MGLSKFLEYKRSHEHINIFPNLQERKIQKVRRPQGNKQTAFPLLGLGGRRGGAEAAIDRPQASFLEIPPPLLSPFVVPWHCYLGPSIHIKKPKATQPKDSGSQMDETPFQEQELKRLIGEFPARKDMSSLEQK